MGKGPGLELAGAVARGDVCGREPESRRGPEPSDRVRDRQEKCEDEKTEEEEAATARTSQTLQDTRVGARQRREAPREGPRGPPAAPVGAPACPSRTPRGRRRGGG